MDAATVVTLSMWHYGVIATKAPAKLQIAGAFPDSESRKETIGR